MNNAELIDFMAVKSGVKKKDTAAVLKAFVSAVKYSLGRGNGVAVASLGIFKLEKSRARMGVNPKTRAPIAIPAKRVMRLAVAKSFKASIN